MRIHNFASSLHVHFFQYFHGPVTDIIDEISAALACSSFCDTIEDGLLSGAATSKPPVLAAPMSMWPAIASMPIWPATAPMSIWW